jgi:Histidine-specific methyltransferase, SAM-dependent
MQESESASDLDSLRDLTPLIREENNFNNPLEGAVNMREQQDSIDLQWPIVDREIYDDYYTFFTTEEGTDILPYLYANSGHFYDNAIKHPDYYIFHDEVAVIRKDKNILGCYLKDTRNIIEIGPESFSALEHKTLPILRSAPNLQTYYALDISEDFLRQACGFVSKNLNVETKSKTFTQKEAQYLLTDNGFAILEIINNSDKIKLFICKKV